MDKTALLTGLPVTLLAAAAGIWLLSRGAAVFGAILLAGAILATMFVVGQGMPRPDVVPRPGEERDY